MAGNTRERILEVSLELFAQSGYLGTSMSDIAKQLGITKGALYKHYRSKQEILDRIVERMNEMDYARAAEYEMPETEHWTKEPFAANFRRMLTLEQYREPKLAQLYQDYLAGGPLQYMAAIFRRLADSDEAAMQLALEFYGPMFLLYSVYDGAAQKETVTDLLRQHIDRFIARIEAEKSLTAEKPLDKSK